MVTKGSAKKEVEKFLQEISNYGIHISDAWLFGSTVNGKTHEYSDIDLALWADEFIGVAFKDVEQLVKIKINYPNIELHTYQTGATENENPFIEIIKKNRRENSVAGITLSYR
ncbi:MAG: nucleotidyltransferase domain-containing protein [Chitinophagales bacterium]|nr:nucleotidyltransferase domain-containing protein [Chitinophagales bacterium]